MTPLVAALGLLILLVLALWKVAHRCGRLCERDEWRDSAVTVEQHQVQALGDRAPDWWVVRLNGTYVAEGANDKMQHLAGALQYAVRFCAHPRGRR